MVPSERNNYSLRNTRTTPAGYYSLLVLDDESRHIDPYVILRPHFPKDCYCLMDAEKLEHFRKLLISQLRQNTEQVRTDQAAALEYYDDGVKDSVDLSVSDLNKEIALRLGERSSKELADIDQALLRIKEGSYGICARCGQPINERRLEAVPTARYDAQCQSMIESSNGDDDTPSL